LGVDEDWTIKISQGYGTAWDFSSSNYYPPLFFFSLVPLIGSFGVLGSRIAFALLATLSILLFYSLARQYFNEKKALVATTLFSFNPLFVFYSVQLRHYLPLMFLFLVLFCLFERLMEKFSRRDSLLFSAAGTVMVYLHYLSWVYIAAFFMFAVVFLRKKKEFKKYVAMFLIPVILFLPIVPLMLSQVSQYSESKYFSGGVSFDALNYPYTFYKFAAGVNISSATEFLPLLVPFVAIVLFIALLGFYCFSREKSARGQLAVFVFGCSLVFFFIGSLKSSILFGYRYLFPLMPLFSLFLAGGIFWFKGWKRLALIVLILSGWIAALSYYYSVSQLPDWNFFIGL